MTIPNMQRDMVELAAPLPAGPLVNADLAPTGIGQRTWNVWHIPSLLRAVVACGWFGIQTWIGGLAINALLGILWPTWSALGGDWRFMGYGLPYFLSFLLFWAINLYFVLAGTESIKWLETLSAPFLIITGLALLGWAAGKVGGIGTILE